MSGNLNTAAPWHDRSGVTLKPARRTWLALMLLLIVTWGIYAISLNGEFVFDDESTVLDNPSIRQLWPLSAVLSPPADAGICGRPLANLTMALNYAMHGVSPSGYHGVNVALHLLAGGVLFGLVRRTLLLPAWRERYGLHASTIAWLAAAVFLWHPVQTNAVAYVSQRVEVLMACCYLLTLYGLVRTAATGSRRWAAFAIAACAAGMASKEVMVTAPVVALLFDRTFLAGSFRAAWRKRGALHLGLASTWMLLAYLMSQAQLAERGIGYSLGVSPLEYALTSSRTVWLYLRLAVWPAPLVFDYGWDFLRTFSAAAPYLAATTVAVGAILVALIRWPVVGFLAATFFVILAPTTSIVPIIQQPIAESRLYLPLASVAVAVALAGARFGSSGRTALLLLAFLGAGLTAIRAADYRTALTLWGDTVAKRPDNARAHNNLGNALRRAGRTADAADHYTRAIQLQPAYPEPHHNLGAVTLLAGDPVSARHHVQTALRLRPDFFAAHYTLAEIELATGDATAAESHLREALRLRPTDAQAHNNLSAVLLHLDRIDEALRHALAAIAADATLAAAHYNCGNAWLRAGRPDAAIACYEAALRLEPAAAETHNNLGIALLWSGQPAAAAENFARTLELNPHHRDAARNLAIARGESAP